MRSKGKHLFVFPTKEGATFTRQKISAVCAECAEELADGAAAYFLGDRLYCPACVREARIEVGVYPVIAPYGREKTSGIREKPAEKRLYFRERGDF